MNLNMQRAQAQLTQLIADHPVTAGMSIRVHGDHLILGRADPEAPSRKPHDDDRVRLTQLSPRTYGLSVKRHTGRWQKTPFAGSLDDMVDTIRSVMQHLVAPY